MNSVDSLSLSRKMNIPFKFLQKLSLSQTSMVEKYCQSVPICFQHALMKGDEKMLQESLLQDGIALKDSEYSCVKLLATLRRRQVVSQMSNVEERELVTALVRTPKGESANIPLLCYLWNYWSANIVSLLSSSYVSRSMSKTAQEAFDLVRYLRKRFFLLHFHTPDLL